MTKMSVILVRSRSHRCGRLIDLVSILLDGFAVSQVNFPNEWYTEYLPIRRCCGYERRQNYPGMERMLGEQAANGRTNGWERYKPCRILARQLQRRYKRNRLTDFISRWTLGVGQTASNVVGPQQALFQSRRFLFAVRLAKYEGCIVASSIKKNTKNAP